jgi:uncharacterized lipoprotein NlpE involved in copper resistance
MGGMLVAGVFVLVGCNADALLCTSCLMKDAFANAKTRKRETRDICENAKIAKVTALQQVQYKVLQYGLYAPIET